MEDRLSNLLSRCAKTDFGPIDISIDQQAFYHGWNDVLTTLCLSLPESTQTDALLFLMELSKIPLGGELNFFKFAYVPTWSIIYWLNQWNNGMSRIDKDNMKHAKTGHSIAVFLHYFDHQLREHGEKTTHLALLLRSQSWMVMNNAFKQLAETVEGGENIVQRFIDDYYSSIRRRTTMESLEEYCDNFRRTMATGYIAPFLLTKAITNDEESAEAIRTAFGSFGLAWRLLDDIQDLESDLREARQTSVYFFLPKTLGNAWDSDSSHESDRNENGTRDILNFIIKNRIIDEIREKICHELEAASSIARAYEINGLADEFLRLSIPLRNKLVS